MLAGNTLRLGIFVGAKPASSDTDSTCVRCPRCNHLALLRSR
jgi:DNA-directed RNA polymerase subunit RPC12/RpoP